MNAQQQINLGIKKRFEEHGIEFAYPTQVLNIWHQNPQIIKSDSNSNDTPDFLKAS